MSTPTSIPLLAARAGNPNGIACIPDPVNAGQSLWVYPISDGDPQILSVAVLEPNSHQPYVLSLPTHTISGVSEHIRPSVSSACVALCPHHGHLALAVSSHVFVFARNPSFGLESLSHSDRRWNVEKPAFVFDSGSTVKALQWQFRSSHRSNSLILLKKGWVECWRLDTPRNQASVSPSSNFFDLSRADS